LDNGPQLNTIVSFDERPDGSVWKTVTPKSLPEKVDEDDDPEKAIDLSKGITL
jgi:hypothetical protein